MIKILKGSSYSPDLGDILYGAEYIAKGLDFKEAMKLNRIPICVGNSLNPWVMLSKIFKIDANDFEKAVTYECPYTKNKYYWIFPQFIVLLKNGIEVYGGQADQYQYDISWWKDLDISPNRVGKTMLGHGFTECTLPYDGSGDIFPVLVNLDNGDALLCHCWVWFNK